jgi:hypothetical protein
VTLQNAVSTKKITLLAENCYFSAATEQSIVFELGVIFRPFNLCARERINIHNFFDRVNIHNSQSALQLIIVGLN